MRNQVIAICLTFTLAGCATVFFDGDVAGKNVRVTQGGPPSGPREKGTLPPQVIQHVFTAADSPTRNYGNIEEVVTQTIPAMNQGLAMDGIVSLTVSNQLLSLQLDRTNREVLLNLQTGIMVTTHRFDVSAISGVFDGAPGQVDVTQIKYLGHD
ncbi:MAG: hypothetical protein HYV07_24700 [Deltaproteobacteria bacterium]|nr:hypothetical protein [Deltaproteobacteria bacterium]